MGGNNIINNSSKSSSSNNIKSVLPVHTPREALVSAVVAVCERCGVEEIQMASCRQCQKVIKASPHHRHLPEPSAPPSPLLPHYFLHLFPLPLPPGQLFRRCSKLKSWERECDAKKGVWYVSKSECPKRMPPPQVLTPPEEKAISHGKIPPPPPQVSFFLWVSLCMYGTMCQLMAAGGGGVC